MINFIHCADLHLSSLEKEYSFSVLDEIIGCANGENADFIVFSGDTFNTFDEAEKLKNHFSKSIRLLSGKCEAILIAGNHEDLERRGRELTSFDLGIPPDNIVDAAAAPFRLITRDSIEFLAIPHQHDYSGYRDWTVPPKTKKFRVALAHATVADLAFTGPDDEGDKAGIIDPDLFARFLIDYAALGHIHGMREQRYGSATLLSYAGSPRVYRKDETGKRTVQIVECGDSIRTKRMEIGSAGQFRKYVLNLELDGKTGMDLSPVSKEWNPNDWIWFDFKGMIEEKRYADELARTIKQTYASSVRRLDVNCEEVESCSGISTHELVKKFLLTWEGKEPADIGEEMEVWHRARAIGLKEIRDFMEKRA